MVSRFLFGWISLTTGFPPGSKTEDYKARMRAPIISRTPTPAPIIVGRPIPETGNGAAVAPPPPAGAEVGAAVGAEVPPAIAQVQSVSSVQDWFLHFPSSQVRSDSQSVSITHPLLQEAGEGEGETSAAEIVNVKPVHVFPEVWAAGLLVGAVGATDWVLS